MINNYNVTNIENISDKTTKVFSNSGNIQPVAVKLLPGLDLVFHDYTFNNYQSAITFADNVLRLDFSYGGSVNLIKNNQEILFLEPGFLKLTHSSDDKNNYAIGNGYYKGMTILLNPPKLDSNFFQILEQKNIIDNIVNNYLLDTDYILIKTEYIDRFFKDIEKIKVRNQLQFFRIKVAELLLYLDSDEAHDAILPKTYFPIQEIKKIYAIHNYLLENISTKITLRQLAEKYNIGQTTMQKLFKLTYYQSVHSFVLSTRLEHACRLLKESDKNITYIANEVGYMNTSKFTAFFKNEKQMTPKTYRQLYKN